MGNLEWSPLWLAHVQPERSDADKVVSFPSYIRHTWTYNFGLGGDAGIIRSDLLQEVDVGDRVLDVTCQVVDASAARRSRKMIIDPADQYLLRRQLHQLFEGLGVVEQHCQVRVFVEVDVGQETDLEKTKEKNSNWCCS